MTADLLAALVPLVVLTPLVGAATSLALGRRLRAQRVVTVIALTLTTVLSAVLLVGVDAVGTVVVEVGGWQAPFGIVLVVDRLSALLLVVSSIVLLAVLLFSVGQNIAFGDDETPVTIYNPWYIILATGVYTAFIAGDLFNLYVGFEILLVASYVLITLGGTEARIRTGTTYIVVSLVSSALFLSSIAMIYGALGTVNLAHIALRMDEIDPDVRLVLHVMLLLGFGIKAAVFPLSFWLPDSYPTAPAPVTAVFAGLLTKVGVYAIIRTETLLFPAPELNGALLVVAALTDWLDGYLARTLQQTSAFGAFLDPVADKLMVAAALIILMQLDRADTVVAFIIIGREITISALREWMAKIGAARSVAVSFLGKVKTASQMVAIPMLLYHDPLPLFAPQIVGTWLIYLAALLTLWSMVYYLRMAWPHIAEKS